MRNLDVNLIGISGSIGSGKDTVTGMLMNHPDLKEFNFENRKFAGNLKKMCGILFGVDPINFEDQDFKKRKLPPIWGSYEVEVTGWMPDAIANQPGAMVFSSQKITHSQDAHGILKTEEDAKLHVETLREVYPKNAEFRIIDKTMSYRDVLQKIGTDLLRNNIHPDVHVLSTFSDYKGFQSNWIISDTRFRNEAEMIRQRRGIVIRVERYQVDDMVELVEDPTIVVRVGYVDNWGAVLFDEEGNASPLLPFTEFRKHRPDAHVSETELDDYQFDHIIYNVGRMDELEQKVNLFVDSYMWEPEKVCSDEVA